MAPIGATTCSVVPTRSGGHLQAQCLRAGLRIRWQREAMPPARKDCRLRSYSAARRGGRRMRAKGES
ncbi:hypothetical protein BHM03_00007964 [Ensete ventricosum]|nr:hypothetical protein BHM03_00007964 [Ensete ventricosum]